MPIESRRRSKKEAWLRSYIVEVIALAVPLALTLSLTQELATITHIDAAFLSVATMHPTRVSMSFVAKRLSVCQKKSAHLHKEIFPCAPTTQLFTSSYSSMISSPLSSNEDLLPGITAIRSANDELFYQLERLREQPFFRLYSVDFLASCEYLPQELFECDTESCEIYPTDEHEIPASIKSIDKQEHDFEIDGWARWDMPNDDYYDTLAFTEEYTGYDGSDVWRFIHQRICFAGYEYDDDHWKADFNKAVSGFHSMVSAQVVHGIRDKEEIQPQQQQPKQQSTVSWTDDARLEFQRRLSPTGETPLAIENLYFAYMLLLSAVSKARDRLVRDCTSGKIDWLAAQALRVVLQHPLLDNPSVAVAYRKLHDHAVKDSDSVGALWEARMRTRELLRIMNCVQCNKCRLHGKISVMGLSTALQILVGRTGEGGDPTRVHRVELAALMTTLHKFSSAIKFCEENTMSLP